MTPATIALSVLCGALAVALWLVVRYAKKRIKALTQECIDHLKEIKRDGHVIADAYALLYDQRHKGKLDNQKQWQAARDAWAEKVATR